MSTPFFSAASRAEMTGKDVMLGVWMKIDRCAWVKSWSRNRLSGVGGQDGVVNMRRKRGLMW